MNCAMSLKAGVSELRREYLREPVLTLRVLVHVFSTRAAFFAIKARIICDAFLWMLANSVGNMMATSSKSDLVK